VGGRLRRISLSLTGMPCGEFPGAMDAGLGSLLFWGSLVFALVVAGIAAFPVNRYLISRGKGHAVVHEHHGH
jgi:uncharacterized RDD family membrane protein YckC